MTGIKIRQAPLAVKHCDVRIAPENMIRACCNNFTTVSLPAKGWIRKHPCQSISLVSYSSMIQMLPHDICMTDQNSLFYDRNVNWMICLSCDPITQAVLIHKTIRILHA